MPCCTFGVGKLVRFIVENVFEYSMATQQTQTELNSRINILRQTLRPLGSGLGRCTGYEVGVTLKICIGAMLGNGVPVGVLN
jgi:hypothetical protein